jgi:mannose-6-phosphate isomerase
MNASQLYPLRFQPIFQRYLWGGRRLAEVLNKSIGNDSAAESWEIVDHDQYQSVVTHGTEAGKSLRELIAESGLALLGDAALEKISSDKIPPHLRQRFPLLLKFLDANQHLSVQVHPDDAFGATLSPPDLGKTEAWYVMHADPGAKIFAGLKPGINQAAFESAVARGTTESVLHSFEPKAGDCVFIPAGTMHAIGAGLLIAEIQQASNTTFRVYDWGRVDKDGKSRPLHIEQAITVNDFSRGPVSASAASPASDPNWQTIVNCDKFVMNKASLTSAVSVAGDNRFHIIACTRGEVSIENDPSGVPLTIGQTVLLPASLGATKLCPGTEGAELLEIHLPD